MSVPDERCTERGAALRAGCRTAAVMPSVRRVKRLPQCPFGEGHGRDTTVRGRAESKPKIAIKNKGLMIAIYDVRETKSDIDWF